MKLQSLFAPEVLSEAMALCEHEVDGGFKVLVFIPQLWQAEWLAAMTERSDLRGDVLPNRCPPEGYVQRLAEIEPEIDLLVCDPQLNLAGLLFPGFEAGIFVSTLNCSQPVITRCIQRVRLNTPDSRQARFYFPIHSLNGVTGFSKALYKGFKLPAEVLDCLAPWPRVTTSRLTAVV